MTDTNRANDIKTVIKTEIDFVLDIAKENNRKPSHLKSASKENDLTEAVKEEFPRLLKFIKEGSEYFDILDYLNDLGFKVFHYGPAILIYLDKENFFYASRVVKKTTA